MKNLKWKKVGSAVLATALAGSMVLPATAYAQGEIVQLEGGTSTQTNTAPEQVFLNKYSGTVRTQNFNDNWKFYLGDASGAQTPAFDDSSWDQVNLPHDYSIDQKYNRSMDGESGYLPGGTGWYRKSFTVDKSLEGKRISIDFGGVYMNATIYVNGKKLGTHPYGYTPFSFDITDNVKFGKENVIAVKVDHQTPSSRFYSGSGIYRDVDFVVTDTVHVDKNGTKIETPDLKEHVDGNNVAVKVKTTVVNESERDASVKVKHTIYPKNGTAEQAVATFESQEAVAVEKGKSKDVSADFTPGIYGILGPNGAGKSTMFGMLTDNLRPDKGSITADGEDIYKMGADYRAKIGYMPQQQSLYEAFTAEKFLWYMAALKGMNRKDAREQIENLLEVVNLKEERYKKLKYFSGGMKQRILLAQALLNDPEILILDEPTAGMDPEERIRIRNFISGCAKDKIVLLATHVVADVENMAREILLIKNGKIVRRDTPQKFLAELEHKVYNVLVTEREGEEYQNSGARIISVTLTEKGHRLRIISADALKTGNVEEVYPCLEDVYLYWIDRE